MTAYAFFDGPPAPPGLAQSAWASGLPRAAPCVVWEHRGDRVDVGLAAGADGAGEIARDDGSGSAAVGRVRLDDPDGLRRALGSPPGGTDVALVLQAYLAWGPGCAGRLDGDFAFAVWDGPGHRLFAARDRFGVSPLYYAARGGRVAVAGRPGPVLAALGLPRAPDPWRVAELVAGRAVDPTRSFFADVRRLPAGDLLLADAGGARPRPYWRPDRGRADLPHSSTEAAVAFRALFDESVRRRLPPDGRVGAALSGGLDSSSIVATVRDLRASPPLPTFTAAFPGLPGADERAFSRAVEGGGGVAPHVVFPAGGHPVAEHVAEALGVEEPLYVPTWPMERSTLEAVRGAGLAVYLSGHGGDHVLSAGPDGVFPDLLRSGRWARLWREAKLAGLDGAAVPVLWELAVKGALRHALRPLLPQPLLEGRRRPPPALDADLAREIRFAERSAELSPPDRTAVDRHAAFLHHPPTHEGLERMAHVSSALGVELRFPFWERGLVDLCFGVQRDALYRDGLGRRLLRDAMAGRLPDAVRSRRSKATFDALLNVSLRRHAADEVRAMASDLGGLRGWVDPAALSAAAARFLAAPPSDSSDAQFLLRALTLRLWLDRVRARAADPPP